MSTPCESVYDVFFDLIEEDRDFFNYYEATDEESYMLAKSSAPRRRNQNADGMRC